MVGDSLVDIAVGAKRPASLSVGVAWSLKGERVFEGERRAPYHSGYARFIAFVGLE